MKPLLPVGRIVGAHGVKGVVKVRSHLDEDSIYRAGSRVIARDATGRDATYTIEWVKRQHHLRLVCFEDLARREEAEALIGAQIFVERSRLPELAEGEYYWDDLIGLPVYTTAGQYLGRLDDIIATGSNDVYVVRDKDREVLVPALEWVVKEIDLAQGRMQVELPEGL